MKRHIWNVFFGLMLVAMVVVARVRNIPLDRMLIALVVSILLICLAACIYEGPFFRRRREVMGEYDRAHNVPETLKALKALRRRAFWRKLKLYIIVDQALVLYESGAQQEAKQLLDDQYVDDDLDGTFYRLHSEGSPHGLSWEALQTLRGRR